jgi:hypothetical protein
VGILWFPEKNPEGLLFIADNTIGVCFKSELAMMCYLAGVVHGKR